VGTPRPKETLFSTGVIPQPREVHHVQIQNQLPRLQAVVTQNETSALIAATKSLLLDQRMVTEQELEARAPHPLLNPKALLWVPSLLVAITTGRSEKLSVNVTPWTYSFWCLK
ncbi:hypothetical protein GX50_08842, partial [[Emmonsia] crescens]